MNPLTPKPNAIPSPYGFQLAVMVAQGRLDEAQRLLDCLNIPRRQFGRPLYEMPAAADTRDGLVTVPA